MSLPDDLLHQAQALLRLDPRRPRQANLRRAVSTAYYSVFHLLTIEASRRVSSSPKIQVLLRRAFDHAEMKRTADAFAAGSLHAQLRAVMLNTVPPELSLVASHFADLQEARHRADYDYSAQFDRDEAVSFVDTAAATHAAWRSVRRHPTAEIFLLALLLGRRWTR